MPVMAVLPLEFIEHQTSQCCEIWWGEHCGGVENGWGGGGEVQAFNRVPVRPGVESFRHSANNVSQTF